MTGTEQRLEQLPAFLTAPATAKVLAALPGSRAVGGAVRDALAGLPVADVDVAACAARCPSSQHLRGTSRTRKPDGVPLSATTGGR